MFLPDSRMSLPSVFSGPVGGAAIDESHPIGRSCRFMLVDGMDVSSGSGISSSDGTAKIASDFNFGQYGSAASTTEFGLSFGSHPLHYVSMRAVTVMMLLNPRAGSSGQNVGIGPRFNYSDIRFYLVTNAWDTVHDGVFKVRVGGVVTATPYTVPVIRDEWQWVVGRWSSGNVVEFLRYDLSGTLLDFDVSSSAVTGELDKASDANRFFSINCSKNEDGARRQPWDFALPMVFDVALSDSDIKSLILHPGQFLVPAS